VKEDTAGYEPRSEARCFVPLSWQARLHRIRLLFRQVADDGQLVHLPLIGLEQQNDPKNESAQANQEVQWKGDQRQKWHDSKDRKTYVKYDQRGSEEQALECMEADESVPVVGLHHQKK